MIVAYFKNPSLWHFLCGGICVLTFGVVAVQNVRAQNNNQCAPLGNPIPNNLTGTNSFYLCKINHFKSLWDDNSAEIWISCNKNSLNAGWKWHAWCKGMARLVLVTKRILRRRPIRLLAAISPQEITALNMAMLDPARMVARVGKKCPVTWA